MWTGSRRHPLYVARILFWVFRVRVRRWFRRLRARFGGALSWDAVSTKHNCSYRTEPLLTALLGVSG